MCEKQRERAYLEARVVILRTSFIHSFKENVGISVSRGRGKGRQKERSSSRLFGAQADSGLNLKTLRP